MPVDVRSVSYMGGSMWRASQKALEQRSVENHLQKLERDTELRAMVQSKMTQRTEETPEERLYVDQVRFYTERRKS